MRLHVPDKNAPHLTRLPAGEIRLSAFLLMLASLPIAAASAYYVHWVLLANWLALWGFVLMRPSYGRMGAVLVTLAASFWLFYGLVPPPNEGFFMGLVLLFGVPEQLDRRGLPNPFNLLAVIFSALCVMVLSAQLLLFVLILVSVVFYIAIFILRFNRMPLSGLRLRLLPVLSILGGCFFVTVLVFLILPRMNSSELSGFQNGEASSGVTDELDMGRFSSVVQNSEIAFRAFLSAKPKEADTLYWRVYVLSEDNHGKWSRGISARPAKAAINKTPANVAYSVRHNKPHRVWLPVLDTPAVNSAPTWAYMSQGGELLIGEERHQNIRSWKIKSARGAVMTASLPEIMDISNQPRLAQWAREKRAALGSDRAFARYLMQHFATQGYGYSLTPQKLGGHKIDSFFFDRKQGYCSHYAMAMATALRAAGIAANVIVGYSGGAWNEFGNYVLVRQSDAHAWVEVKLGDIWQRFDPTTLVPPVSPSGDMAGGVSVTALVEQPRADNSAHARLQRWVRWVDNFFVQLNNDIALYDSQSRAAFFADLSVRRIMSYLIFWVVGTVALMTPFFLLHRFLLRDPMVVLDRKFHAFAKRIENGRALSEGRLAYAYRVAAQHPDIAPELLLYAEKWCRHVFSTRQTGRGDVRFMRELLRQARRAMRR